MVRAMVEMDIKAEGKFIQKLKACGSGGSWMVIIPAQFMRLLEWAGKDEVVVELDYAGKRVVVHK